MPNEGFTLEAMKFAVMPDSFKGALSAGEAAAAITRGLLRAIPAAQISTIPMADGGKAPSRPCSLHTRASTTPPGKAPMTSRAA